MFLDPRVKSLNYLNNILAKREANLCGADDALLLNAQGQVAEASAANIFVVTGNRLATPSVSDGALEGMTRRTVLEIGGTLAWKPASALWADWISMPRMRPSIRVRAPDSFRLRHLMARRLIRRRDPAFSRYRQHSKND